MRRLTKLFKQKAINSLILAVEVFNRPTDLNRTEITLLLLSHAFEMLFKSIIYEKTGVLRKRGERENYDFKRCLAMIEQFGLIDRDSKLVLLNIHGFRDAAAHDIVDLGEQLLLIHAQSAVIVFRNVVQRFYKEDLTRHLPNRVLPVGVEPPRDLSEFLAEELEQAAKLLRAGQRKAELAYLKLRAFEIMEANIDTIEARAKPARSTSAIVKRVKAGEELRDVFPNVAQLALGQVPRVDVRVHLTRKEGVPAALGTAESPGVVLALRYIRPEDKYPFGLVEVAQRLGVNRQQALALIDHARIQGKEKFHTTLRIGKTVYNRYSQDAVDHLKGLLPELDLSDVTSSYTRRRRSRPA